MLMSSTPNAPSRRLLELDALRGIAVLLVALFHFTTRYDKLYTHDIAPAVNVPFGSHGVLLFFIISGFVIFMTLDRTRTVADFVVSRFSRLYPAYWAGVILSYTAITVIGLPGREVGFGAALVNLTMLQKWLRVSSVDGVYWTLTVEMCFYVLMLILFATGQLRRLERAGTVWLALILAAAGARHFSGFSIHWPWRLLFVLEYGNLFLAGMMFYKLRQGFSWPYALVLPATLLAEYLWRGSTIYFVLPCYAAFTLFLTGHLRWLATPPLLFLGNISYSLYLVHLSIGYIIIRALYAHGLATPWSVILVPLAATIPLAWAMYHWVERPALVAIRSAWKARKARLDADAVA